MTRTTSKSKLPYENNPAVNKSTLWAMRKSPLHYQQAIREPRPDTAAFRFGRAVHMAVLEPDAFEDEYMVVPEGIDRRTKAGKEAYAQLLESGCELISESDYVTIDAMVCAVRMHPFAQAIIDKSHLVEHEIYWEDTNTGVSCKGRCDMIGSTFVADYKTTTDASTDAFLREAIRYGYDLQAAMYLEGTGLNEFYFIAQEKTEPFAVNVIKAGDAFLDRGRWIMNDLLEKYKGCVEWDAWPGYNARGINELILPEYLTFDE